MGSPRLTLVGTFVIGGLFFLFAVGLFMIGDRRLLFTERFEVEANFGNVTGIAIGTAGGSPQRGAARSGPRPPWRPSRPRDPPARRCPRGGGPRPQRDGGPRG